MSILVIDCGTYSIKFIEGRVQKKKFIVEELEEILLEDVRGPNEIDISIHELQQRIISGYLQDQNFHGRIITQLPNEFLTNRYLDLPAKNKKDAELMIPFQLEEDLPFNIIDTHYIVNLYKKINGQFSAIVQIAEKNVFATYRNFLQAYHTVPSNLTSELSVYQSFVEEKKIESNVCILDIGHETTKAYLVYNGIIYTHHISYVAGAAIDEAISKTYDIGPSEARIFKHENSFFLTKSQLDSVTKEQQDFALMMHQTFKDLLSQIDRWLLGHRVKTGQSIEHIYLTGGSANIKNIDNYITERLKVSVSQFMSPGLEKMVSTHEYNALTLGYTMGATNAFKEPAKNFFTKEFASALKDGIKLENTIFSFYRVAIVCLIIIAGLLVESFYFINNDIKTTNREIRQLIKTSDLNLTRKQTAYLRKRPERLQKIVERKNKAINIDLEVLESVPTSSALKNLHTVTEAIKRNTQVSLTKYRGDLTSGYAEFNTKTQRDRDQLIKVLKKLNVNEANIDESKQSSVIISFKGK
ncbi:hypothetical protein DAY19_14080 [Halobacteriovorax vibrionivorans]|uniref:SHS2 domain-containing protein n=1 Tax=Halobacteriovorax vibrionivorans TaxID=2152716 RepID=A0ABY0IDU3_9BACT|nr:MULTISPECIES: pilus assembly protein PilM [Halobacteriovorax]RZF21104.1 hypothetical protein DAY19_14080 [Halobacteriovorax vibrionivorans]TGD47010.1 hypothetical protein EP118_09575 [Halobacteriovorax sp. Y22]